MSPPEKRCTCPLPPAPLTYSLAGMPMRCIRHSSVSADPVDTAISGMLSFGPAPASVPGSESLPLGMATLPQEVVVTWISLRHLPTWMTRGTLPTGTLVSLKEPSTPVTVLTTAPLWKSAPQLQAAEPVGTPCGNGCRAAAGT